MMKLSCAAIVLLGVFLTVLGQPISIVFIDLPPTIPLCGPFLIRWIGGAPIYNVSISAKPPEATETLHETYFAESTQLLWDIDQPPDSAISVIVSDRTGSIPGIFNSKVVADCPSSSPSASALSSAATSHKMNKAIAAGIVVASLISVVLIGTIVLFYLRRRRTCQPASQAPRSSSYSKRLAASRSTYAKSREVYLEREILALQEQISNLKRQTRLRASFDVSSPIDENVEREITFVERQMNGLQEEMGVLREEREALHGLGCRSEASSVIR